MADESKQYLCYLPMSLCTLDGTDLKFMISILYKMRVSKRIENMEFKLEDAKGISRMSFFRSIKSLKEQSYLKISKVDKSTYAISLNMESKHFTEQDIEHLTRPFRNALPEMNMGIAAQQSKPQAEIKPLDWSAAMGVKSSPVVQEQTAQAEIKPLEINMSNSDIKFRSDSQKAVYEKMWKGE